jgi:hypothetical protein
MASKQKQKAVRSVSVSEASGVGKRTSKVSPVVTVKDEERSTLAYKVLSAAKTKKLMDADDVDELEGIVADILELQDTRINLKSAAILDYYVAALWWCKEQSYNADQTSAFFTVIDTLLNNIDKHQMNLADNIQEFKKMLVGIGCSDCVEDETENIGGLETLFDVEQAKNIITYVHFGLFQHYTLYQMLFSHDQMEYIIGCDLEFETPKSADLPWPPPLCEAIPESIHKQYFPEEVTVEEKLEEDGSLDASSIEGLTAETTDEDEMCCEDEKLTEDQEQELISKLSPEQLQKVINEVCIEMLAGLEEEVASKLRKKENEFIARINNISIVSTSPLSTTS